jgi:cAMP-dependent protein kinase regulator
VIQKSAETREKLKKRMLEAFMFNALEDKEFEIVVDSIAEVKVKPGDQIIKEGDEGDCMYIVESGTLTCTKHFKGNAEPTFLKEYHPGEGFGELALLYNAPRAATIKAKTEAVVWRLDRDTFNHIVKDAASRKREKYENFLQSVKILSSMDPYERSKIADALNEQKFKKSEYVIKEGDIGDKFFIIIEGEAVATKVLHPGQQPQQVLQYKKGEYFGERALLTNEARAANIIATVSLCQFYQL